LVTCRRKNLGYLFAIEHGATNIYDADEDNHIKYQDPPTLPSFQHLEYYVYNATGDDHLDGSFAICIITG
jgi:hypothetical protein